MENGIRSLNVASIVDDSYDVDYMPLFVDYVEDVEVLHHQETNAF